MQDWQLLDDYLTRNSESAFRSLVSRYADLVHSTALRHARNAALAEEVAQAVFILLARKGPRLGQTKDLTLGGWLYRTTRFVASRALRGELRRQRREQEAIRMREISSADDTWRRIAPVLDEGIERLNPTGREAVVLRFLQDEPLREVAHSLGISEEAARKRVDRSLDQLRAFFVKRGFTLSTVALVSTLAGHKADAAPAGLADAIGARVLAHAAASAAPPPVLVAETLRAWHRARVTRLAGWATVAAVVVSALLMAIHAWRPESGPAPGQTAANLVPASTAAAGAPVARSQAGNSWRLSFQAVDGETGQGIANARVLVGSVGDLRQVMTAPQQIDHQTNLWTDPEGRCEIRLPYAHPLMVFVGVLADGYAGRTVVGGEDKPLPESYVMKMPRGARIGGVVRDESGQPIAGAGIAVPCFGAGDASGREFQRERPGFLDDDPVTTTDRAGRWAFASAPTNGGYDITVTHPAFPSAGFRLDRSPEGAPTEGMVKLDDLRAGTAVLVVKAGLTLRGVVTDESGYGLAGATVNHGRFAPEGPGVATGSDGAFALPALKDGDDAIIITAEGYAPQRIQVTLSSNTVPLAVQLKRGGMLRLRVVDLAGAPVPGAQVALESWQGPSTLMWGGLTDPDGRLEWNSAPLEPIMLDVLKHGYFNSRRNPVVADGEEHAITLRPQLTLSGRVTDAQTKQPIALFKAVPEPNRNETAYGTNGQFRLAFGEVAAPLVVRIEAEGYEPATSGPLDARAVNLSRDFELKPRPAHGAVEGVVLLSDGSAAAGAQVALRCEHAVRLGKQTFEEPDEGTTTQTGVDGHFSFKGDLAPRAVVAIHKEGFACLAITPGNRPPVSIRLQPWGRVEGVLRLKTQPISGQTILLSATPAPDYRRDTLVLDTGAYTATTDEQGRFVLEQVPPGDCTFTWPISARHSAIRPRCKSKPARRPLPRWEALAPPFPAGWRFPGLIKA